METKAYEIKTLQILMYQVSDIKQRLSELNTQRLTINQNDIDYLIDRCERLLQKIRKFICQKAKKDNLEQIKHIVLYIDNLNDDLKEIEEIIYN